MDLTFRDRHRGPVVGAAYREQREPGAQKNQVGSPENSSYLKERKGGRKREGQNCARARPRPMRAKLQSCCNDHNKSPNWLRVA